MIHRTYGRLTVLGEHRFKSVLYWLCRCTCGSKRLIAKQSIVQGLTQSCGCLADEVRRRKPRTHGMTRTRTYNIWCGFVKRCENAKEPAYAEYGGRGIKVCARWRKFENFLADMGPAPAGRSLDRIDNDGDYAPGNCRWATRAQQARNTSRTIFVTVAGERLCVKDWADRLRMKASTIYAAKARGINLTKYIESRVAR